MALIPFNPIIPGWGVDRKVSGMENLIVADWESSTEVQSAYCYDNKGAVCRRQDYDTKKTITATVLAPEGASLSKTMDTLAIDGATFAVLSAQLIESNRDFQKIAFTLEAYANCPKAGRLSKTVS